MTTGARRSISTSRVETSSGRHDFRPTSSNSSSSSSLSSSSSAAAAAAAVDREKVTRSNTRSNSARRSHPAATASAAAAAAATATATAASTTTSTRSNHRRAAGGGERGAARAAGSAAAVVSFDDLRSPFSPSAFDAPTTFRRSATSDRADTTTTNGSGAASNGGGGYPISNPVKSSKFDLPWEKDRLSARAFGMNNYQQSELPSSSSSSFKARQSVSLGRELGGRAVGGGDNGSGSGFSTDTLVQSDLFTFSPYVAAISRTT